MCASKLRKDSLLATLSWWSIRFQKLNLGSDRLDGRWLSDQEAGVVSLAARQTVEG